MEKNKIIKINTLDEFDNLKGLLKKLKNLYEISPNNMFKTKFFLDLNSFEFNKDYNLSFLEQYKNCEWLNIKNYSVVDNFDLFLDFMNFDNNNDFYYIQIIQRAKDNKEIGCNNRTLKDYFIYSKDSLLKRKNEIIKLCESFNARAYIHPTKRNSMDVSLKMLEKLSICLGDKNPNYFYRTTSSACGVSYIKKDKLFLVDIDEKDLEYIEEIKNIINIQYKNFNDKSIKLEVPTKSGIHLICSPFDVRLLEPYNVDIHKNNPTILYCLK